MGGFKSTLYADGKEVEDGSLDAVKLYEQILRDAYKMLMEHSAEVRSLCPDVVEQDWQKRHAKIEKVLSDLTGRVSRFAADYEQRGLSSAVSEASFRGEL